MAEHNIPILTHSELEEFDEKYPDDACTIGIMDFLESENDEIESIISAPTFVLNENAPLLTLEKCKGELMLHQSAAIWMLNQLESSIDLEFRDHVGNLTTMRTNRYKLHSPIGSGKTKTAIGLIIFSNRPKIKPIYFSSKTSLGWCLQERIFDADTIIWPTVVVARSSIYSHWHEQITEFSYLRVYSVGDSKSLIAFVKAATENLAWLNANYDVVIVDYKTISGKTDVITNKCAAIFDVNIKKSKQIVPLMFNALSGRCFARIIYDDSEFHMKAAVFENAISCIYLSATHSYGRLRGASKFWLVKEESFENSLEYQSYTFDANTFTPIITVSFNQTFLNDSGNLGIPEVCSGIEVAEIKMKNMMPPEPEVWLCPVVNDESKTIDIISCLCDDAKIMESVNNLAVTSFASVIKRLMADRFSVYEEAMKIVSHWSTFDLDSIDSLPKPPEGSSFTINNLLRCEPIQFAWRDLANRISELISDQQKVIDNERLVLDRVKESLSDKDCGVCLESLKGSASAIMMCCNKILHIRCILKWSASKCPFCRVKFGPTSKDTFVPMHHDTDFSEFVGAKTSADGMGAVLKNPMANDIEELTKISVLHTILLGRFSEIKKTQIRLKRLGVIIYDPYIEAKCEDKLEQLKILIYSSADDTLKKIEAKIPIEHAHLTSSASSTAAKIRRFRSSQEPTSILANTWTDAAGIDFKTATDVVIMNYISACSVVQQMIARLLRMGRTSRPRIWLIAYQNECDSWLNTHCEPLHNT